MQPLKYKVFQNKKMGLITFSNTEKTLDAAAQEATEWMNSAADEIQVVHVAVGQTPNLSHIIVWYRELAG